MAGHLDESVWCGLVSQISASPGIEKEIVNLILLTSSRFHENTILISGEIKKLANNFIERRRDALKFKSLRLLVKTKVWMLFPEIKREKRATKGEEGEEISLNLRRPIQNVVSWTVKRDSWRVGFGWKVSGWNSKCSQKRFEFPWECSSN